MGGDEQTDPDLAAIVKRLPSASSAPYDVAQPFPRAAEQADEIDEQRAEAARERAKAARRTARILAPLTCQGWVVMHDRIVAGTSVVLDHVLVGPAAWLSSRIARSSPPRRTTHKAGRGLTGCR